MSGKSKQTPLCACQRRCTLPGTVLRRAGDQRISTHRSQGTNRDICLDGACSKLKQVLRARLRRCLRHWRCLADRRALHRELTVTARSRVAWDVWQEWQRATITAAAKSASFEQRAETFMISKTTDQGRRCLQALRSHAKLQLCLRASSMAYLLHRKKQLFKNMQRAARETNVVRWQVAHHAASLLRRSFRNWLLFRRHRRRDAAVTHLLVVAGGRTLQLEALRAWAAATTQGLAADWQRRRNLLNLHWKRWSGFASAQRGLQRQQENLVARCALICLWNCFTAWRKEAKQRLVCRARVFAALRTSAVRRRTLCKAMQRVSATRDKAVVFATWASWKEEARAGKRCRAAASAVLCKRAFDAFHSCGRRGIGLSKAAELVPAHRRRFLAARVMQSWSKLQQRLQSLRQRQLYVQQQLQRRSLRSRWALWRRRTATATALRQWITQALDGPTLSEAAKGALRTTINSSAASSRHQGLVLQRHNAAYTSVMPSCC